MDQINILVADDDKNIVEVLTKLLEQEGYLVHQAYNGIEALELVQKQEFQLILLDVMMPKMNGMTAMLKIREKKNIPIIILSAKTEESDIVSGLELGADDYIEKPFNTPVLLARVKAQIRRCFLLENSKGEETESILRICSKHTDWQWIFMDHYSDHGKNERKVLEGRQLALILDMQLFAKDKFNE